jgi:group I intron endonuclease
MSGFCSIISDAKVDGLMPIYTLQLTRSISLPSALATVGIDWWSFCVNGVAMQTGIYEIRNMHNGHIYIGSAVNVERRWGDHKKCLNRGTHHSGHLQNAWNKYGADAFEFTVIELCFPWALIMREQHFMDTLCPEYNICPIAGNTLGRRHTEETRAKLSAALKGNSRKKGKIMSEDVRRKISESKTGKTFTEERKRNMSEARKGKPHSEEHRQKISESHKGITPSDETRKKLSEARKLWWSNKQEKEGKE